MATINNSETALLLLLSEGNAHPYQIEKEIKERSMDYWTDLSRSSIYKTLRQLERKGLATSEVSLTEKNVGKKTYALTAEGRTALRDALREFIAVPERIRWRFDLASSHLDLLSRGEIEEGFRAYAEELRALIAGYGDLEGYLAGSGCPEHAMALARRPRALYEAELAWLADYRERLALAGCAAAPNAASPDADASSAEPGGGEGREKGGTHGQA